MQSPDIELNSKLRGIKEFLHMVVHDLRNPAALIDSNLDKIIEIICSADFNLNRSSSYPANSYTSDAPKTPQF